MTESLRREIIRPTEAYTNRTLVSAILIAGGGLAAGLAVALAPVPAAAPAPRLVMIETAATPMPVPMPVVVAVEKQAASPRASEVLPVFRAAGATYLQLASVDPDRDTAEVLPKHGKLRYLRAAEPEWTETVIAAVGDRDVPAAHRAWRDRTVVVEGGCTAKVTGFAVVARLTGDVGYAPGDGEAWNAKQVLALGSPVLAAKLDGCADGRYARDAALPAVVVPQVIEDAALVAQAKAKLVASHAAEEAQRSWSEMLEGAWHASTPIEAIVVRHPGTGVTWVSVHARADEGCGGPDVNVWGLFRVTASGELVATQLRNLGELHSIATLIDVEGDGELEVIGAPWLANATILARSSGEVLASDEVPFYGCPC